METTIDIMREQCREIYNECWEIFTEFGGYEYNDEMYWQISGLRDSIDEYFSDDKDVEYLLGLAIKTGNWFMWVKKIRTLQENEPESLFC
jgi:hypothetical protein